LIVTGVATIAAGLIARRRRRTGEVKPVINSMTGPVPQGKAVRAGVPWADWALVVVGFLSLVLAGVVAFRQTAILENQADLMRAEYLPVLQLGLETTTAANNRPDIYPAGTVRERLTITNTGGQAREFRAGPMAFLKVRAATGEPAALPMDDEVMLPFFDYYGPVYNISTTLTGNTQGTMASWLGPAAQLDPIFGAPHYRVDLGFGLSDLPRRMSERTGVEQVSLSIVTYVDLHYVDIFGDRHREVYSVTPSGFGRVDDAWGAALMDTWNPITSSTSVNFGGENWYLFLLSSTPDDVVRVWRQIRQLEEGFLTPPPRLVLPPSGSPTPRSWPLFPNRPNPGSTPVHRRTVP